MLFGPILVQIFLSVVYRSAIIASCLETFFGEALWRNRPSIQRIDAVRDTPVSFRGRRRRAGIPTRTACLWGTNGGSGSLALLRSP